jgi:hypothetical protein
LPRYAQAYVLPEIFISHPESLISQPIPILMDTMPFNKNPDKEFIMNDKITQLHSGVLTLPRINYHFIISSSSMSGSCYLKLFFNTGNPLSIPLYWKQNGGSVNILDKNKESIILKITNDDDINNENLKLSLYEKIQQFLNNDNTDFTGGKYKKNKNRKSKKSRKSRKSKKSKIFKTFKYRNKNN